MKNRMEIFLTIRDVADLCSIDVSVIDRLARCGIHPPWRWARPMKSPRWSESTIPQWLQILDEIDLSSLPADPPPLEGPGKTFAQAPAPTADELKLAARMLGLPVEMAAAG